MNASKVMGELPHEFSDNLGAVFRTGQNPQSCALSASIVNRSRDTAGRIANG
jgi:hypothetical protein